MASGYNGFVPAEEPTAAEWNDYVNKQVLMVFADATDRNTQLSGILREGMRCILINEDREYTYTGSAWVRTAGHHSAAGRTGCRLRRAANQSIATGGPTGISWDTEDADTDAFIVAPGTTVTIPSGLGGMYAITVSLQSTTTLFGELIAGGVTYNLAWATNNANSNFQANLGIVVPLAVADTISAAVFNTGGGAVNVTGRLNVVYLHP